MVDGRREGLMELESLLLIVVGVILGSILGTEYASWRMGRKLQKWLSLILNIHPSEWNGATTTMQKRELLFKKFKELMNQVFPMPDIPRPPLQEVTLTDGRKVRPETPENQKEG